MAKMASEDIAAEATPESLDAPVTTAPEASTDPTPSVDKPVEPELADKPHGNGCWACPRDHYCQACGTNLVAED
jgi:hypothetical protein